MVWGPNSSGNNCIISFLLRLSMIYNLRLGNILPPKNALSQLGGLVYSPLPPLALLRLMMRVKPLGLLYAGLPCDSMGFMSSSVHQRSAMAPWGAPRVFVFLGNTLACRLSILVLVGIARGVTWMLENPLRTAVDYLPPIQWLLQPHFRPLLAKWFLAVNWQTYLYFNGCWRFGEWQTNGKIATRAN